MNLNDIWTWLVTSSADPNQTALTAKAFLVGIIPLLTMIAPTACSTVHLCIDTSLFPPIIDLVGQLILDGLTILSMVMAVFGIGRKIYYGRWAHPDA